MQDRILRHGNSGPLVRDLQLALNSRLNPSPNLMINGIYDHPTVRAVRALQVAKWLEVDGIAGPCTLDAVYETEQSRPILHNVQFLPQPTETTCWAAAAAMVTGKAITSIRMRTPVHLLANDGGLLNEAEAGSSLQVHQTFARIHGLRYHAPQSWRVEALIELIRSGPLMMELLWNPESYRRGRGSSGHYYVIVGARGSHGTDGQSSTLRIYNPYPVGQGAILSRSYASLLRLVPLASYGIMSA